MADSIKKIAIFVIIIGTICVAINLIFGNDTVGFAETVNIGNGLVAYKYHLHDYIDNIRLSITETTELELILPDKEWVEITAMNLGPALSNNLALILDYWILLINVTFYPIRVGAYLIRMIMALIGVNVMTPPTNSNINWLITLINDLISLQIPYTPTAIA